MKVQYLLIVLFSVFVVSCQSDLDDIGSNIQPAGDAIVLKVDSFTVVSENMDPKYLYSRPDSFMLGNFYDNQFGTFQGEILTQLMPPIDVKFPENAAGDSASIVISYGSAFGDRLSPFEINAYQMDLKTLSPTARYTTDLNVNEYSSGKIKLGSKVTTVDSYGIKRDSTLVVVKLNSDFVQSFAGELRKVYTKSTASTFFDVFKGLHIKTQFGSETLINVNSVFMRYYYHYTYVRKNHDGTKDSVVTVNHYQDYPATNEVRSVNSVKLPRKAEVYQSFQQNSDVNVVSSPGNIYTSITLPMSDIRSRLNAAVGNKKLLLNRAILRVNVAEVDTSSLALPIVNTLLLINEDSVSNYFYKRGVPKSSEAVSGTVAYEYVNDTIQYYYNFDLAQILTTELEKKSNLSSSLKFRLMPVVLSTDNSGVVKDVKEKETLSAVKICSGTNTKKPMKLQLVFSGF